MTQLPEPTPETLENAKALGPWLANLGDDEQGPALALIALIAEETGSRGEALLEEIEDFLDGRTPSQVFDE